MAAFAGRRGIGRSGREHSGLSFIESKPGFARAGRPVFIDGLSLNTGLWWALATTNAALLAAIVWAVVTPVGPLGAWHPLEPRTIPVPARAALFASFDPFNRDAGQAPGGSGAVTALALTLYATRSAPNGQGSAIIAGADGVQQVYRAGAEVVPGVVLARVAFDHVELTHDGAREMLYLDQSEPAPDARRLVGQSPGAAQETAGAPAAALTVEAARSGIGFAPRGEGGRVAGLEVMAQGNGQAFRAAGFQAGDVVTSVNGKQVTTAGDLALMVGALRPGSSISVTVRRGDRVLPLAIPLAQ